MNRFSSPCVAGLSGCVSSYEPDGRPVDRDARGICGHSPSLIVR
jgi:hypothetical protein